MNAKNSNHSNLLPTFLGLAVAFVAMGVLIRFLNADLQPPPLGTERALERKAALEELRRNSRQQLQSYALLNPQNQTIQIPIERAMQVILEEWQDPATGRARFLERVEKAFAVPAAPAEPAAAQEESIYE